MPHEFVRSYKNVKVSIKVLTNVGFWVIIYMMLSSYISMLTSVLLSPFFCSTHNDLILSHLSAGLRFCLFFYLILSLFILCSIDLMLIMCQKFMLKFIQCAEYTKVFFILLLFFCRCDIILINNDFFIILLFSGKE